MSFMGQTHIEGERERGSRPVYVCGRAAIRPANLEAVREGLSHDYVAWKPAAGEALLLRAGTLCLGESAGQSLLGPAAICWVSFSVGPPCCPGCQAGHDSLWSTQEASTSSSPQREQLVFVLCA